MDKSWLILIFLIVIFIIFAIYRLNYKGDQKDMVQTTAFVNPVLGFDSIKDKIANNLTESFNNFDDSTYDDPDDDDDDIDNDNSNRKLRMKNELKNRIKNSIDNRNQNDVMDRIRPDQRRKMNLMNNRNSLRGGDDINWKAKINDKKKPGRDDYARVGSKWIPGESNEFPASRIDSGYRVFNPNVSFRTSEVLPNPLRSENALPPNNEMDENENFEDYYGDDTSGNFFTSTLSNLGAKARDFEISNLMMDDGSHDNNPGNFKPTPAGKESTVTISRPIISNSGNPGNYKPGHDPREKYPWMYPDDQGQISYKSPNGCPCPIDSSDQGAMDLKDCVGSSPYDVQDESCACFNTHGLIKKDGKMYRKRPGQDYEPDEDPKRIMMRRARKTMNKFPTKIKSEPPTIQTSPALEGDNYFAISSIDGFEIGDEIKINENCNNEEKAVIANLGSNLLYLTDGLKKDHYPNEPVYNLSNQNIIYPPNKKCLRQDKNYYGYDKSPGKILPKIAFNPKSTGPKGKRKPLSNLKKRLNFISNQQNQFQNRMNQQ